MPAVVLVTGCSTGLGRALAVECAQQRDTQGEPLFQVYASARRLEALADLPPQIEAVQLDVTDDKSVAAAVSKVLREAGRIDALICNAGLSRVGPLLEQPLSEVNEVLDTNVLGVLRMVQAVGPGMVERRSGMIVSIGSVVSWVTTPFGGSYSASKSALLSMSQALRMELAPFGVQVCYVTAGSIKSNFGENASVGLERYTSPSSAYHPIADAIKARAQAGQDPRTVMTAEATAKQIVAVLVRSTPGGASAGGSWWGWLGGWWRGRPAPLPAWTLAGGKAPYFFFAGLVQRTIGWPIYSMLSARFGLQKLQ